MKSLLITAILFACSISWPVAGAESENWMREIFGGEFDAGSRDKRLLVANGLLEDLESLRAYVPPLNSEQTVWLARERANLAKLEGEAFNIKMRSFFGSSEFQLANLNGGLERLTQGLNCIIEKKVTKQRELYCWTYVAWELTDGGSYNDAILRLHSARIVEFTPKVKEQFGLTYSEDEPWGGYVLLGRSLLEKLVLPFILK